MQRLSSSGSQRPQTASSRSSNGPISSFGARATDAAVLYDGAQQLRASIAGSRPSTASSAASSSPHTLLQTIHNPKYLNAFDVDKIKDELVAALEAEHTALLEDIEYLQTLMGNNLDVAAAAEVPPPPLQEMKVCV